MVVCAGILPIRGEGHASLACLGRKWWGLCKKLGTLGKYLSTSGSPYYFGIQCFL